MKENSKRKLREYFEMNLNKGTDLRMVWDTSKAYMQGYFIQQNSQMKRNREQKTQNILNEIFFKKKS